MRLSNVAFLVLITGSIATSSHAQQQDWIPQGIESLGQNASSRTEFTLDHSMLVFVSKLDQDDEDLRRVIAGVDGVSVHSYRFPKSGMYDSEILNSVHQQFHAAGWKHMVSTHDKDAVQAQLISGFTSKIKSSETSRFSSPGRISSTSSRSQDRSARSTSSISADTSVSLRLKAESSFPCPRATGSAA